MTLFKTIGEAPFKISVLEGVFVVLNRPRGTRIR